MIIEVTHADMMFSAGFIIGVVYTYFCLFQPMMRLKNRRISELEERIQKRGF